MIDNLIEIAREAGEIIKDGFGKNLDIQYKSNETNLVTQIDKASEKTIVEYISKKFPSHGILAEESGNVKNGSEYLWVVDPLDGTTNFAHGLPIFSVSIGLQKNGKTIAGVVYDVMQNIIYSAEAGSGAFANSKRIKVNENNQLNHGVLVTGFPYNISENPDNALGKFTALTKVMRGIRRLGSAAIDFSYVANGVFDGFWEVYLHPWDVCAGILIVQEAGGMVTDFDGREIDIYSKRFLASNKKIHPKLIDVLKSN
jgi:myo-inositol-1(or 4)-monophosphatase